MAWLVIALAVICGAGVGWGAIVAPNGSRAAPSRRRRGRRYPSYPGEPPSRPS